MVWSEKTLWPSKHHSVCGCCQY